MKISNILGTLMGGAITLAAPAALASCDYGTTGYLYVYAMCTQEVAHYGEPEGICEVAEGEETSNVYIVSNVIKDDGSNDRYPSSQFYDELELQLGHTDNGSETMCYSSRDKAEDALREDFARFHRDGWIIASVKLGDS